MTLNKMLDLSKFCEGDKVIDNEIQISSSSSGSEEDFFIEEAQKRLTTRSPSDPEEEDFIECLHSLMVGTGYQSQF